jgi:hypothetical protein
MSEIKEDILNNNLNSGYLEKQERMSYLVNTNDAIQHNFVPFLLPYTTYRQPT